MKYSNVTWGQMEAILNKIGGEPAIPLLLSGDLVVVCKPHIIRCDATPFVPPGWSIITHAQDSEIVWSDFIKTVEFHQLKNNQEHLGFWHVRACNANLLDYLLAHPNIIPVGLIGKKVYFPHTVYKTKKGTQCVRYLEWRSIDDNEGHWAWDAISVEDMIWTPADVVWIRKD